MDHHHTNAAKLQMDARLFKFEMHDCTLLKVERNAVKS